MSTNAAAPSDATAPPVPTLHAPGPAIQAAAPTGPRLVSPQEAKAAAARLLTDGQGRRIVVRFSLGQRLEHQLLIVSFSLLAVTGLPQRFADTGAGSLILQLLGGIEAAQALHHLVAAVFILEAIYHVAAFLYGGVARGRWGSMWPAGSDFARLVQMLRYNLGLTESRPQFGRYTFEEKFEYWALVWGGLVMILTGLLLWLPIPLTRWLTGAAVPVARAIHGWEAILAVLSVLSWHLYHAVLKHFNRSIFTGVMTEEEMRHEHPAELAYLERAASAAQGPSSPTP